MNGHGCRIAIAGLAAVCQLAIAEVQTAQVRVKVPDYQAVRVGELDEARIPGGQLLEVEEGRPLVPYYVEAVEYTAGSRVQDVRLVTREGLKTDSGLRLPAVSPDTTALDHEEITPGVYPLQDFDWDQVEQPDKTVLLLHVYPFRYDPKAKTVEFHRDYVFEVSYVRSAVSIGSLEIDPPAVDPGQTIVVRVGLANAAAPVDVRLAAAVVRADEVLAELSAQNIGRLGRADSARFELATTGYRAGQYWLRVVLSDMSGSELARAEEPFRLGVPKGEVTDFSVEPRVFRPGADVRLELTFANTGSTVLSGECVFRIVKAGDVVDEFSQELAGLKPGGSRAFRRTWSTADAERGVVYQALGFVRYEGTASEHRIVAFSTNAMPVAEFLFSPDQPVCDQEVVFDGTGSNDPDGRVVGYRWQFDEVGESADSVATWVFAQPGEYDISLTVTDGQGGSGTITRQVFVAEE